MIGIIGTDLYQWDTGRSVSVTGASYAHFANKGDSQAVIMELADGQAKIPDYLLQTGKDLCVYAVNNGITIERKTFSVRKRERPENYIYDEDHRNYIYQIITDAENAVSDARRATNELLEAKANGEFDGPKGDKGDPGKTPVKGEDYYTESDKTEMVNAVIKALPTYNGEVEAV